MDPKSDDLQLAIEKPPPIYVVKKPTIRYLNGTSAFPPIFENPTFRQIVANFNNDDMALFGAATAVGACMGFIDLKKIKHGIFVYGFVTGLMFGFGNAYLRSYGRLTGILDNTVDREKWKSQK